MLKAIKENFSLISVMIVLVGTSSTDAYYSSFGLRYQYLNISAAHILFRGVTAIAAFHWLLLLYVLAVIIVAVQTRLLRIIGDENHLEILNHLFVVVFVGLAWVGGRYAGSTSAAWDMEIDKSSLPVLSHVNLKDKDSSYGNITPNDQYRLLIHNSEGIQVFKALSDSLNQSPIIIFIPTGGLNEISVCSSC